MARWHEFGYYPPSRPREAKGGIKAQSKRGTFALSWWGQRWIATLESFPIGTRLGRGRSYARKGQVISLEIDKGRVAAEVQGSRTRPYAVSITMKPIATSKWRKIAKQASERCCQSNANRSPKHPKLRCSGRQLTPFGHGS